MREETQKKIDRSIKLLKATCTGELVELAYSGGKDSDVILQLAKEAGINYRAIYKNTTIDPPGTIKHAKDMNVEIRRPDQSFFELVQRKGVPGRMRRFCCSELKEYKILDKCIIGVRREESRARSERYKEPTACRFYNGKKDHVEQIFPILDWTQRDVEEFIIDRGIKCAPVYYDEDGVFRSDRRLGCMCCPLASYKKRIGEFKKYPNMVKAYCRNMQIYIDSHPDTKVAKEHKDAYSWFYRDVMCRTTQEYNNTKNNIFGSLDYRAELEKVFGIKLEIISRETAKEMCSDADQP